MNTAVVLGIVVGMTTLGPANAQEWRSVYPDSSNCITLAVGPGYVPDWACEAMNAR